MLQLENRDYSIVVDIANNMFNISNNKDYRDLQTYTHMYRVVSNKCRTGVFKDEFEKERYEVALAKLKLLRNVIEELVKDESIMLEVRLVLRLWIWSMDVEHIQEVAGLEEEGVLKALNIANKLILYKCKTDKIDAIDRIIEELYQLS